MRVTETKRIQANRTEVLKSVTRDGELSYVWVRPNGVQNTTRFEKREVLLAMLNGDDVVEVNSGDVVIEFTGEINGNSPEIRQLLRRMADTASFSYEPH